MSALLDFDKLDLASEPSTLPPSAFGDAPDYSASPIPTAQLARTIRGQHTELLLQVYGDRIFLLLTQLGRIGALVSLLSHIIACASPVRRR